MNRLMWCCRESGARVHEIRHRAAFPRPHKRLRQASEHREVGRVLSGRWRYDPVMRDLRHGTEVLLSGSMWIAGQGRRDSSTAFSPLVDKLL